MRILYVIIGVCYFCMSLVTGAFAGENKPIIKVIDSLNVDLSRMDTVICMDEKLLLTAPEGDIFACEWIDAESGDTISRARSVWVSPDSTHQYRLNLYYFSEELIPEGNFESDKPIQTEYKLGIKNWPGCARRDGGKCGYKLYPEGYYAIGTNPNQRDFHPYFFSLGDHTTGHGKMMVVNGSETPGTVVWETTVQVKPKEIYAFSAWGIEVSDQNPATFHFTINGVQLGENHTLMDSGRYLNRWEQFYQLWEADSDVAKISLVNLSTSGGGNDFAIDDISFASMKKETGIITVKVLPSVKLGKLEDITECEGVSREINALATGTGISGYKWTKDGVLLANAGSLLQFNPLKPEDAGIYKCSVTGECGIREDSSRVVVRKHLIIDKERDTVRPCEHERVILEAGAQGYLPQYRWSRPRGSEGWIGEKSATYQNDDVVWSRDQGTYSCKVTSVCGEATVYRVLLPREELKIIDWPGDLRVCAGSDVRLYAGTNQKPYAITWGGRNLEKRVEGEELWLRNVQLNDAGSYNCVALDECMAGDSRVLVLQVAPRLYGFQKSKDTLVCENGKAVLWVKAQGSGLRYNWKGPGGFHATTPEITIEPVSIARTGTYEITVTDSCENTETATIEVGLIEEYENLEIKGNLLLCDSEMAELEMTGGSQAMTYEWTLPEGGHFTGSVLRTKPVAGEYLCRVQGKCPFIEKSVTLRLRDKLQAEAGENKFYLCPGEDVKLTATAKGENITYEWWKGDRKMGEGNQLNLNKVKEEEAGIYDCYIHSACGDTVLHYEVWLKEPLKIREHTSVKYMRPGEKTFLFVNVSGEEKRKYEWLTGGKRMEGSTGNILEIQAPNRDTVLYYTCRISACNVVMIEIPVYVHDFQTIAKDTTVYLCEGMNYSYRLVEKLQGECENSESSACWIYNGKDTVSRGEVLTFQPFREDGVGEYVCIRENKCGKEKICLNVYASEKPRILAIRGEGGTEREGVIIGCMEDEIRLVPEIRSDASLIYEWSKDGVVIPGATRRNLVLQNLTAARKGRYSLKIVSAVCGQDTKEVLVDIYKKLSISYLPEVVKCPGEPVLLQVKADASAPSEFVWTSPGEKGWTTETDGYIVSYKNPSVQVDHSGNYHCEVRNICGTASADISLSVEKEILLPEIPAKDTICPGESKLLSIPFEQEGVKFFWILPDKRMEERQTLLIEHFSEVDTGTYRYGIQTKNGCFDVEGEITLYMRTGINEIKISRDTAVCEGQSARFSAFAEGKEVKYEWWGPQNFRAQGPVIHLEAVHENSAGSYEVVVTDICNQTGVRGKVKLSLLKEFEHLSISRDTGGCERTDVDIKVITDKAGLDYEWKREEQVVGHDSVLHLSRLAPKDAGKYICRVSGTCQTVEKEVSIQVYPHLSVSASEISPVCVRDDAVLTVAAVGEGVTYRWLKGGEERGFRTSRLTLEDVIPGDVGLYECRVNSLCGDTVVYYDFHLKETTRIIRHSADRVLCEGDEYKLWVKQKGKDCNITGPVMGFL